MTYLFNSPPLEYISWQYYMFVQYWQYYKLATRTKNSLFVGSPFLTSLFFFDDFATRNFFTIIDIDMLLKTTKINVINLLLIVSTSG